MHPFRLLIIQEVPHWVKHILIPALRLKGT